MNVHVLHEPPEAARELLVRRVAPETRVTFGPDVGRAPDYDVLVAGRPPEELLDASPRLASLVVPYAGLPPETRALLLERPRLAVHNLHHNAAATAEHALALLLAAAKLLVPMDRSLRAFDWRPRYEPNPSVLLEGRTAVVLGYGAIGRRVARMCVALGMSVVALRRRLDRPERDGDVEVRPITDLAGCLPRAGALIVAVPLTVETRGLLGAAELEALPERSVLVNVGRGPILDEGALYRALTEGPLAAAGLDVWWDYPKAKEQRVETRPSSRPFHELDNVVLSPHRAGAAEWDANELQRMEALAASLAFAARGEEMPHRVDVEAGY